MKKIGLIFTMTITALMIAAALTIPESAYAAGEDFSGYWDFDDYTASVVSRNPNRPNGFVATPEVVSGYWDSYFGSADCSQEGRGRVLAVSKGEVVMRFDDWLTDGKLHISYDARATDKDLAMMTHFWTNKDGTGIPNKDNYSKPFYLRNGMLQYYKPLEQWAAVTYDSDFDYTKWHHYDIIATGITEKDSYVSIYVDGKLIDKQLYLTNTKGIYGVSFRVANDVASENKAFYIDNLNIRHYYNDAALAITAADGARVDSASKKIRVRLSEKTDESLLTRENISVTSTGVMPPYSIENVSDMGFDIKFNDKIPYARYTINLSDNIKGAISGTSVKYPLDVKTEERWVTGNADFADFNFNSYTNGGVLPDGFVSSNEAKNEYVFSEIRNAASGDTALGIKGFGGSTREITSLAAIFDKAIEPNKDYSIEFEVKSKNMRWWLYIREDGDTAAKKNRAAIGSDENGVLKYAAASDKSSVSDSITDGEVILNPDEWHKIKINVKPNKSAKETIYDLYVDGEKYTVSTLRELFGKSTEGIAFGYNERGADSELYLDNIKVSGEMTFKLPEVEKITFYDVNSNAVRADDSVTTMINKAEIKFNTRITKNFYDYIRLYLDSVRTDYDYELADNDDKTNSVIIRFDNMLKPLSEYIIEVETGLSSAMSDSAATYIKEKSIIYTGRDSAFELNRLEYDEVTKTATAEFVKNNAAEGSYIFAVCAYKNAEADADGVTKTVRKLVGINFVTIEIKADDLGSLKYTLPLSFDDEEAVEVVPYLWNYPSLTDAEF